MTRRSTRPAPARPKNEPKAISAVGRQDEGQVQDDDRNPDDAGSRAVSSLAVTDPRAPSGKLATLSSITPSYFTRIVRLGFLAPDVTAAILDGRQPIGLSALKLSLANLPKDWLEQRREPGFR